MHVSCRSICCIRLQVTFRAEYRGTRPICNIGQFLSKYMASQSIRIHQTLWSIVLLDKVTGSQPVKKFPSFYGTCPPPVHILSHTNPIYAPPPSHFLKNHCNIILPSTSGSSKWSLLSGFPIKTLYTHLLFPHTCYMPRPSHSSRLDKP